VEGSNNPWLVFSKERSGTHYFWRDRHLKSGNLRRPKKMKSVELGDFDLDSLRSIIKNTNSHSIAVSRLDAFTCGARIYLDAMPKIVMQYKSSAAIGTETVQETVQ